MWAVIAGVINLVFLILKTKFEQDADERKRKDELLKGWDEAIKSGDKARITAFLDKLNGLRK